MLGVGFTAAPLPFKSGGGKVARREDRPLGGRTGRAVALVRLCIAVFKNGGRECHPFCQFVARGPDVRRTAYVCECLFEP